MKKLLLSIVVLFVFASNSFASHVMGADITYTCLGGNQYQVTLTLYRDCLGSTIDPTQTVNIASSCGNVVVSLDWVSTLDVSQVCPTQTTTCNGGTLPGTEQYIFSGIVTLPPCNNWVMSWSLCCRNDGITNLNTPGSQDLYIETTLNSVVAPCNNSPQFLALPTPYLCPNQLTIYNHGASDVDGDSLYYQFTIPLDGPGAPIAFTGGYSQANPIITTSGMNLNPQTGEMCFTPSVTQISVVSVIISEYRNNVLIGTYIREMQVVVANSCANTAPFAGTAPSCGNTGGLVITYAGPTVTQTDSNSLSICPFDSLCFRINFLDPDGDNVTVNSNAATSIPGATFTITNNGTTNPIGDFCWAPTPLDSGINVLTVHLLDDACPISANQYYTYDITVFDQPYAGQDQTICGPQWAQLNASGGAGYSWSVLSGEPLNPGVNITCNPCANPQVKPLITTTYLLTSTLTAACINTDTITITVVPNYSITTTQSDNTVCLGETVNFTVTTSPAGAYNYLWTPASIMDNPNSSTPTATFTTPGLNTIIVNVDNGGGCLKSDTMFVTVSPAYAPNINIVNNDTSIGCNGNVQINLNLGGGIPASCGASSSTSCSGPTTPRTVGTVTGANSSTGYPAPYGNWYKNAKHQFLYTATELNALGFIGGKITQIGWEITAINGTTTYNSYTIKMGCTTITNLTTWETGLTQVFNPKTVNIVTGYNMHTLDVAYEWDGISNLVIEICYDNLAVNFTNNSITPWTTTSFTSSIWYRDDDIPACPETTTTGNSTNRPVTRFITCPTTPDPTAFNYNWTPTFGVSNPTIQNPVLSPGSTTTYTVTVTDPVGGCFDTDSINIIVSPVLPATFSTTPSTCNTSNDGQIIATGNSLNPPFTFEFYDSTGVTLLQTSVNPLSDSLNNIPSGTYLVRVTDVMGCSFDTLITLLPTPEVFLTSVTNDTTICINQPVILTAIGTGGTGTVSLIWDNGLVGNGPHAVTPLTTTRYLVFAQDAMGCTSQTDTINITVNPNAILLLTSGVGTDAQTVCTNSPITPITYTIGGGGTGATITGLPTGVTGSYNAGIFTISGTPTDLGTFGYTINTTGTCVQTTANGTITLNNTISITPLILSRDTICPNDTDRVTINPANGGSSVGYTYNWFDSNNNPVGSGLSVIVKPTISPETYTVVVGDNCSTPTVTQNITVYWFSMPQPSFVVIDTADCFPITASFTNTTILTPNINTILWDFGDGVTSGNILTVDHGYLSPDCFDVTLTIISDIGCSLDTTIIDAVCAYGYPIADFTMSPQPTDITNPIIQFSNQSFGNVTNYWTITGGYPSSSIDVNPITEYLSDSAGTYQVQLLITNSYGCQDSISKIVKIDGLYLFYIPNSFTPDGDFRNETFKPIGDGINTENYHFMIFDRWGEKLFETDDLNEGWDGTYKGTPVENGVYVWKINAKELYRNVKTEHSGHVNLIR